MSKKQISFFVALPRTGSTLLGSIINQSKQIKITGNSFVSDILCNVLQIKESQNFKNFPYHQGVNNIIYNVFNNYYANVKCKVILDKSPWGTPYNLELLRNIFKKRKFIILIRPVLECLASFVKVKKNYQTLNNYCEELMDEKIGMIGKNIWSIKNLIKEKEDYLLINYNDLIKNTQKEIDKIFDFLKIKREKLNLNNIEQFKFEGVSYDDSVLGGNYHTIRVKNIEKINYKVEDYLSEEIIKKYKNTII